jgi:hypothetical protein
MVSFLSGERMMDEVGEERLRAIRWVRTREIECRVTDVETVYADHPCSV